MKALTYHGAKDVRVETVADPRIVDPDDIVLRVTATAICGSDLHIYRGKIPRVESGDILGHEFMGIVEETGPAVTRVRKGDRVVVPFTISCGRCFFCEREEYSLCENTNPNAGMAETMFGHSPCGIYGYSHLTGGYAGGQAEYARVPFADIGPIKIESDLPDDKVLFLSDIFPTGWMAAENCNIQPGDTVAIWGCGPVGLFAMKSAWMLGAGRVIAIDRVPERLRKAREDCNDETIDYSQTSVLMALKEMTGGRGPDSCMDAVGMEAHGHGLVGIYDKLKQTMRLETERPIALREAIIACRNGGTVSVPGVYGGLADKIPVGAFMNKGLTFKTGQTHMQRYLRPLLERVQKGEIDPSFVITHHLPLDDAPRGYKMFRDKQDECIKVVLKP